MLRVAVLLLTTFALVIGGNSESHAAKRLALVIGINSYPNMKTKERPLQGQLQKAVADAETMAEVLRSLDFEVDISLDANRVALLTALDRFKRKIEPGDTVFVFFAGHGISLKGSNLLLPSDMPVPPLDGEQLIRGLAIAETDIIGMTRERKAGLTIMVMDACRNNPIEEAKRSRARDRGRVFRSSPIMRSVGLNVGPSKGVFAIYSAGHGQLALDRLGADTTERNSVFTRVFAKRIVEPGRHLPDIMEDVREEVARLARTEVDKETKQPHIQYPAYYNETLGGRIFLAGRPSSDEQSKNKQDAKLLAELQKEIQDLKEQLARKIAVEPAAIKPDDSKITALEKEIAALKAQLSSKSETKKGPRDDGKISALQEGVKELRKELAPKEAIGAETGSDEGRKGKQRKEFGSVRIPDFDSHRYRSISGKRLQDCDTCPQLVILPPGSFMMGSPLDEADRLANEGPQRLVVIPKPFAIGKREVSVEEFREFAKETGHESIPLCRINDPTAGRISMATFERPGFKQTDSHPAVCITWEDAKAYVDWLSKKTGKSYRLPTEAEWEYAARAGSTSRYHFDDSSRSLCLYASFLGKRRYSGGLGYSCTDGIRKAPDAGGQKRSNSFGLHDMHGNVKEWVEDCYFENYKQAPNDGTALSSSDCSRRVLRGGSWFDKSDSLRSAARQSEGPRHLSNDVGFRVVRTLTADELK